MLLAAGCTREGGVLRLPSGKPFAIEFLDSSDIFQPHVAPFQQNLRKLGIDAHSRIVDAAQYKSRTESFDYDVVAAAFGGPSRRARNCGVFLSSASAAMVGSRNLAGVADPAVDALVEKIVHATTRAELNATCRALDRVLRAGHYWVPMWYNDQALARLLGRVLAPRTPAETGRRRARHLVVGRRKGEENWAVSEWRVANGE